MSIAVDQRRVPEVKPPFWTLRIPAPAPLWSSNDSHRHGPRATSANRVHWRAATYTAAAAAKLPKGLSRVRIFVMFHFTDRRRRDALNYADTAKPIVDAFGPPFVVAPTVKASRGKAAPGWGLIPDDTPEYLEFAAPLIGSLWRDVLAGFDAKVAHRLASPYGGVTVTIVDSSTLTDLFDMGRVL